MDLLMQEAITCPNCREAYKDRWESDSEQGVLNCNICGTVFKYERSIIVIYDMKELKIKG